MSWAPWLKSSRNKAPDPLDTVIIHSIDRIPPKIPARR